MYIRYPFYTPYIILPLLGLLEERHKEENLEVIRLLTVWKEDCETFVHYNVFAQLRPSRHPNNDYPGNTSHSSQFV